ncbi:MAG: hypothetical protein M3O99_10475 [Chloroflexota bacterium]|nr:hypothetical protein [Chloroflexota bacterium]
MATTTGIALVAVTPSDRIPVGFRLGDVVTYLTMPASLSIVGWLIAVRRPSNPIGWALSCAGAVIAAQFLAGGYAVRALFAPTPLPGGDVAAWIFNWSGSLIALMLATLLFTFPNGILPLRRTRVGLVLGVAGSLVASGLLAFTPGPLRNFPAVDNPFGVPLLDSAAIPVLAAIAVIWLLTLLLATSTLWERARRSNGAERQQFKWFIGGVVFCFLLFAVGTAASDRAVANVAISAGLAAPPIAIGVAILRYRLYDIDLLINRTLVYGATSAAIAATFFAGIVALQALLRPLTSGSELAVAASTLISFALFQPIRRRVQGAVDRRFDRSRYNAAITLDAFADRLSDEVDLDALRADLLGAVRQTMSPSHASLWLRSEG